MKKGRLNEAERMLANLVLAYDDAYVQEHFYPVLIEHAAGRSLFAPAVGMIFAMAIPFYVLDHQSSIPKDTADVLWEKVPSFIDAMVEDPDFAKEIKEYVEQSHP